MDYDVVRTNIDSAYTNFRRNNDKFYEAMNNFYSEGKKNPVVAKIMMNDRVLMGKKIAATAMDDVSAMSFSNEILNAAYAAEAQKRLYYSTLNDALRAVEAEEIYENTRYLSSGTSSKAKKEFDNEWNRLYPRTGKLRDRIINSSRVVMGNVIPKTGWFDKITMARTLAEYREDYPKTFNLRYMLISKKQITEGNISKRVSNWFERLFYKKMLKGQFCFKK